MLTVTEMLREHGVVDKFIEFGPGLTDMPVANRATIANMARPSTGNDRILPGR